MSSLSPSDTLLDYLFVIDYRNHFAWVLVDPASNAVVADGRFVRNHPDSCSAEIAFIVADRYQGRGAGAVLLDAVVEAARVAGIQHLTAQMLLGNRGIRSLLSPHTAAWRLDEPGVVSTSFATPTSVALRTSAALSRRMRLTAADVILGGDRPLMNQPTSA